MRRGSARSPTAAARSLLERRVDRSRADVAGQFLQANGLVGGSGS